MQKLSTLQDVDEKYRGAIEQEYRNLAKAKLDYKVKSKSINTKIARKLFNRMDPKTPLDASPPIDSNSTVDEKDVDLKNEVAPKHQNKGAGNVISLSLACIVIVISVAYVAFLSMNH